MGYVLNGESLIVLSMFLFIGCAVISIYKLITSITERLPLMATLSRREKLSLMPIHIDMALG